jgi:Spy/CpxP family protein refolding chaperone
MMLNPRNNRTLLFLIMVLLMANGVMLYLLTRPEPTKEPELTRNERSIKMAQDALGLTPAQAEKYLSLRGLRDSLMKPHQDNLRAAKLVMMQLLQKDSVSDAELQAAAQKVGAMQVPIEMEYLNHFRRMKTMLEPAQQPKFDTLLQRMVMRTTGAGDSLQKVTKAPGN